jgi:hypothetical protein
MKRPQKFLQSALILLSTQIVSAQSAILQAPNASAKKAPAASIPAAPPLADALPVEMLAGLRPEAMQLLKVADLKLLQFEPRDWNAEKLVDVTLAEQSHVARLTPFTLRTAEFKLLVQDATGALTQAEPPDPLTYRGYLADEPQSQVAASIIDGRVYMTILRADGEVWNVQPVLADDPRPDVPKNLHAVFKSRDVLGGEGTCGADARMLLNGQPNVGGGPNRGVPEGGTRGTSNQRCQIVFDTDVEFYQANGSSISATVADIEMIMNQVGLIYQNQVAISYYETGLIVRTALPQPYTSTNSSTLLCQFGEFWNNNLAFFPRDVGQLFTGKDLDGTTVGLGWIGVICAGNFNNCNAAGSSLSYSLVQSRFSTVLASRVQDTAHELGHNWNGCHCNTGGNCGGGTSNPANCGIMTSGISGSATFDAAAVSAITTWRDNAVCLDAWQNPTYVNWSYGGFSTGSASQPWVTVGSGVYSALVGGEVRVQSGTYLENLTINKALTINALNGTVTIGN